MSGSDRDSRDHTLAALFCALVLFGTVILIYAIGQNFGIAAGRNEITAREHYEDAKKANLRTCAKFNGVAATECVAEAIEAAQDKSDSRQELFAQKDMANFTFWSVILSGCALGVTILGVWYVKRTLDTNVAFLKESQIATAVMEEGNRISRMQMRAFVLCVDGTFEIDKTSAKFTINLKNFGNTNALEVKLDARLWIARRGRKGGAQQKYGAETSYKFLIPSGSLAPMRLHFSTVETRWSSIGPPQGLIHRALMRALSHQDFVWWEVAAQYYWTDIFGERHAVMASLFVQDSEVGEDGIRRGRLSVDGSRSFTP